MSRPVIYIAGPLSAHTEAQREANCTRAIRAGIDVYHAGGVPFIPHLNHWAGKVAAEDGAELIWQDFMEWDIPILRRCDALIRLPGESKGASVELLVAREFGLACMVVTDWDVWDSAVAGDELEEWIREVQEACQCPANDER
jgi:hypothetical protein